MKKYGFFKRLSELELQVERLQSKHDSLLRENNSLLKRIENVEEENNKLDRIIRFSKQGEITFKTDDRSDIYSMLTRYTKSKPKTYIYKDYIEFLIEDLVLVNPKFTETEEIGVISVLDYTETKEREYVIDLCEGTYITTKSKNIEKV